MPEESKRKSATTVGEARFAVKRCDCNARGCKAWHILSGDELVAVVQHERVAREVQAALFWMYDPATRRFL